MSEFKLLIDGKERAGNEGVWEDVFDPATGQAFGRVTHAGKQDLDDAMNIAVRGLAEWSAVPTWERGTILHRSAAILRERKETLGLAMTREQGKPLREAIAEVDRSADFMEWGAEQARRITGDVLTGRDLANRIVIETHPIGVVAAFTPWNFPMALAAKKFAGALGAGCSIICKPSQETPGSVLGLVQALLDAGVHPAAVGVVFGAPADVSSHMINASQISKITFTGSIPVGKMLAAEAGKVMKPVTMELGGHAPVIVCKDMDPEATADFLVTKKFTNAGQICLSPTRFFVESEVHDRFVERFVARAAKIRVGAGTAEESQMGPLASVRRVQAISDLVEDARAKGATIATGGQHMGNSGYFYAPTVLTDIPPEARILHEEPFGPVAAILRFDDEAEMVHQANSLEFGLSAYLFTNDAARQRRLADAMKVGTVGVNDVPTHLPEVPLGGWKESGYGTEGGQQILTPYQKTKFVSYR
ncbi:NAD-dependent succinate-semialdehyde dehydrogenase [Metarhizobium album]|uniref:NAD-dependent succinate-semialdehyde dehydrogenase n=1 Tax=Metarhizobium album TaxID=2182425 RepID=A0A2U2DJ79_9HYPH|nr:NAD-dependent succinate-semialdehyde dehydrogenase [Rhizobium album]PWE53362.1 NAD-dependent succinate-semialdehyde dehydrogenase [Rhizobium album]